MKLPDVLAPYKLYVFIALVALAVVGIGLAGKKVYDAGYKNGDNARSAAVAVDMAGKDALIAEKNTALRSAAGALSAAGKAIGAINRTAQRQLAAARSAQRSAEASAAIANRTADALRSDLGRFAAGIGHAKSKSAACKALYEFDIDRELAKLECPQP
jgi:hypothetical protein